MTVGPCLRTASSGWHNGSTVASRPKRSEKRRWKCRRESVALIIWVVMGWGLGGFSQYALMVLFCFIDSGHLNLIASSFSAFFLLDHRQVASREGKKHTFAREE